MTKPRVKFNMAAKEWRNFDFIVVGGGIAGVSCTEYLSNLNSDGTICLISSTDLVKAVCNIRKIARNVEEYDVKEKPLDSVASECGNVTVVKATVVGFEPAGITVLLWDNVQLYTGCQSFKVKYILIYSL